MCENLREATWKNYSTENKVACRCSSCKIKSKSGNQTTALTSIIKQTIKKIKRYYRELIVFNRLWNFILIKFMSTCRLWKKLRKKMKKYAYYCLLQLLSCPICLQNLHFRSATTRGWCFRISWIYKYFFSQSAFTSPVLLFPQLFPEWIYVSFITSHLRNSLNVLIPLVNIRSRTLLLFIPSTASRSWLEKIFLFRL